MTTRGLSTQLVRMSAEHVSRISFQRVSVTNTQVGEPQMRRSTAFRVDTFCGTPDLYFDPHSYKYWGADKSLARLTSPCILFDGENISFDASLVIPFCPKSNANHLK